MSSGEPSYLAKEIGSWQHTNTPFPHLSTLAFLPPLPDDLLLPVRRELADGLVVARQAVHTRLDEDKTELAVTHTQCGLCASVSRVGQGEIEFGIVSPYFSILNHEYSLLACDACSDRGGKVRTLSKHTRRSRLKVCPYLFPLSHPRVYPPHPRIHTHTPVLVLAVALEMLAHGHGLLDEAVEILRDIGGEAWKGRRIKC